MKIKGAKIKGIKVLFSLKRSLQGENSFAIMKVTKGMGEKGIRKGAKESPHCRVQKVQFKDPLNQSNSSNFAPLMINNDMHDMQKTIFPGKG